MNPLATLSANIGRPLVRGPLALFPVFTSAIPAERYRTGPAAVRRHTLAVGERDGGNVPELTVTNRDHRPLLLLEGETILGNRQHRTINVSVLIPAGASLAVPVSCVEQGRWGQSQRASRAASLAPARLRSAKLATVHERLGDGSGRRDADQRTVWDQVSAYATEHQVHSQTGALEDVHAARADDVRHLVAGTSPLDGQRGVVAVACGEVMGLDLFDKPGTLARYWDALVGAYALDAVAAIESADVSSGLAADVESFLAAVLRAAEDRVPGVGAGDEVHIRGGGIVGHALVWDDAIIHLSAFPVVELAGAGC